MRIILLLTALISWGAIADDDRQPSRNATGGYVEQNR